MYDRQEVNDVLRHLRDEAFLSVRFGDPQGVFIMPFNESEEAKAFWFVGEKDWYHV